MVQTTDFLPSQNPTDQGLGFFFPDSQDATGLELGLYDKPPISNEDSPMTRADFAIITTTLDGIVNCINVLADEIANHTAVLMKKLEEVVAAKSRKDPTNNACFTCGETGHWSSDCPQKTTKKSKERDPCYKCGQVGHWIADYPKQQDVPSANPSPPKEEPPKKKRKAAPKKSKSL
ncbi:uncharacterized protein LOC130054935 [Ostrea edulis]|uniref:uncharacterized protein LOC130054935 n=1 Tax=Ostrea edulis TaxID=37623 RepID=UPI0024AE9C51|nr:uncharacterized protein LOC130054935 [Ostrea edulis]